MRFRELTEMKQKGDRAGVYPIYRDESGTVWVFLMIPSKAEYGGAEPQMGKGRVDDGETPEQGGFREAQEELGLRMDNIKKKWHITTEKVTGLTGYYDMHVYGAEVNDPEAFDAHSDESGWVGWLTLEDALTRGRKNQRHFLQAIK